MPKPKSAGSVPESETETSEAEILDVNNDKQTFVPLEESATEDDTIPLDEVEQTPVLKMKMKMKAVYKARGAKEDSQKEQEVLEISSSTESDPPPPPKKVKTKKATKTSVQVQQPEETQKKKKAKKTSGIRDVIEATKALAASEVEATASTKPSAPVSKGKEPKQKSELEESKGKLKVKVKEGSKRAGDGPAWQPKVKAQAAEGAKSRFVIKGLNFLQVDKDDLDWLMAENADKGIDKRVSKKRSNQNDGAFSDVEVTIVTESKPPATVIRYRSYLFLHVTHHAHSQSNNLILLESQQPACKEGQIFSQQRCCCVGERSFFER